MILVVTVVIAVSIMLIIFYNLQRQKRTEKLLQVFAHAATAMGLSISKKQVMGSAVIGLDEINNKLLYLEISGRTHNKFLFDLGEIESCTVRKTYLPERNRVVRLHDVIQTIGLKFNYRNRDKSILLPVYIKSIDPASEIGERMELARQWQAILSDRIIGPGITKQQGRSGMNLYYSMLKKTPALI